MKTKRLEFNKTKPHKKQFTGANNNATKSEARQPQKRSHRYFDLNKSPTRAPQSNERSLGADKSGQKNKRLVFNENGDVEEVTVGKEANKPGTHKRKISSYKEKRKPDEDDGNKAWYLMYSDFNTNSDIIELKDSELKALAETCRSGFESQHNYFVKRNPSDAKWLETALHKGTAKDRVNSGALLVHSNPLANLQALETLIGLIKVSNRVGSEVLTVISELFMEALIPSNRKLLQLALRGADWKTLRNRDDVPNETKNKIYAYWHFESELKEQYFEFLKNLQQCLQTGQEPVKSAAVVCGTKLLCHGPEKEQLLLSMLINKLGDPSNKIAAKALHHLSEVTFKHPNMCGVITNETEKLLFRNNISEQAQHFALCFLAQIAPRGRADVCSKLVNICFAFFKVLVKKGAVNNRTMQAILRCLQKAIVDAKPSAGETEIMNKEMQDTVYRLVHLADIQISIQTLSLLLQLITVKGEKPDRFYNALYRKMIDMNLTMIGAKCSAQFFHIVHRAIHMDSNVSRSLAFIKRLLQISMYMPAHLTCGCLIVVSKVLKSRPELRRIESLVDLEVKHSISTNSNETKPGDDEMTSSDDHEVLNEKSNSLNSNPGSREFKNASQTAYDPYNRVPAFAGAQFIDRNELVLLQKHFHPTCKVFTESIIARKGISYYGDPLRDFSLSHFLERFAFKNPKKADTQEATPVKSMYNRLYIPNGGRSHPVHSLTMSNCTEEERFIFNYLEKKREKQVHVKEQDEDETESVDDDEFDAYLDGLSKPDALSDEDDGGFDFLKEMAADLKIDDGAAKKKKKNSKTQNEEDDSEAEIDDWSDGADDAELSEETDAEDNEQIANGSDDDAGSISFDENESLVSDEDESLLSEENESDSENELGLEESEEPEDSVSEDEEEYEPQKKKTKSKIETNKKFHKSLKHADDMSSLFAAADDFAELLEETGKDKRHGTSSAIFNADKSSEKQLKWEEKRRQAGDRHRFAYKKMKKFGSNKRK